jgi:hypothetical protein
VSRHIGTVDDVLDQAQYRSDLSRGLFVQHDAHETPQGTNVESQEIDRSGFAQDRRDLDTQHESQLSVDPPAIRELRHKNLAQVSVDQNQRLQRVHGHLGHIATHDVKHGHDVVLLFYPTNTVIFQNSASISGLGSGLCTRSLGAALRATRLPP